MKAHLLAVVALLLVGRSARADDKKPSGGSAPACPDAVKTSVHKAFADGTVVSCVFEREDGRDQYEVKLTRSGGARLELDVAPDGTILQTEEKIDLAAVPAVVMKAFAAKYPKDKPTRAEKETHADGGVFFEIGFKGEHGRREATFKADGTFTEEE